MFWKKPKKPEKDENREIIEKVLADLRAMDPSTPPKPPVQEVIPEDYPDQEQTVTKLKFYKGKWEQETMHLWRYGHELQLKPQRGAVEVMRYEYHVGMLPPALAQRVIEEGYAAAMIESVEEERTKSGDWVLAPTIRIIWKK